MKNTFQKSAPLLTLVLTGMLAAGPVYADKPDWAGGGKKGRGKHEGKRGGHERNDDRHEYDDRQGHSGARINLYFNDHQREIARSYYGEQFRHGHCPPGLAKQWMRGRPLPRTVVYYDVPTSVVIQLGYPPAGHRCVRVASDILMIAIGTGMVVDAIEDLDRM